VEINMTILSDLNANEKIQVATLGFLTIFCVFLEIILHFYLGISTGYTHFFYILLVLAAIWYQRKAVILAFCLAVTHFSIGYFVFDEPLWVPFLRSAMFVLVTLLVGIMAEGLKKAEAAVCAKSNEWELTFNATSDGICLLDENQKIKRCNRSMVDIVDGIPVQDLIGRNCWEIVHKTTGPIVECPFVTVKKTLVRHIAEVREGDKWFEITADPILDNSGAFTGAVHIMRDITGRKRVDEEIRLSNVILNTQQETSPDGILVVDISGKIISFNRRFTEIWSISQKIIDSRSDEQALSSVLDKLSDPQEFISRVRYLYDHQLEKSREEIILKDGRVFERYSAPMHGEDNRYFGRVWYFRDITERKRAETALRNSQQILEGILNTIPFRVFWKDHDLKYLGCNRPFAQDAGFTEPNDVIGKDDYAMGWKDQAEIYRSDDRSVIASGKPKVMIEEPQTTPDGKIIWLLTSKVPLRDAAGEISGVLGTYMDISEYRNAKETIRESEEKYKTFFATSKDCVFITSKDGRFEDFNDETPAFFGYRDREEFGTVRVQDLYRNAGDRLEHIRAIEQSGFVKDYPVDLHKKDGSIIYALITSVVRLDISGKVIGFQGTIKDITKQKQAEEALKESNERYISYIKEAAMRLKTPVEVVERNINGIIKDVDTGDIECSQVLLQLQIQAKNMEQIRQNIIDLNKTIIDGYGELSPASKKFLTE
jgi:PAS domain S-box-containing protein